jgi:hypothetical protein
MERNKVSVGRGMPIGNDGMWFSCNMNETVEEVGSDRILSAALSNRRHYLLIAFQYFAKRVTYRSKLNLLHPKIGKRTQWKGDRGVLKIH